MDVPGPVRVRIAQVGDLHIGRRWLSLQGAGGVNQRELDLERSLEAVGERLSAEAPDLVVLTGDLWDSVNPSTRARSAVFRFCRRLRESDLPVVVLAGNHDHARSSALSPLVHLSEFFGCHLALEQGALDIAGVRLHLLPYASLAALAAGTELASFDLHPSAANVLVAHAWTEHPDLEAVPERVVVPGALLEHAGMDLCMLGHIHQHRRLGDRTFYAGPIERLNWGERDITPGLWLHTLEGRKLAESASVPVADLGVAGLPRPLLSVPLTQGPERTHDELNGIALAAIKEAVLEGAIVQVSVTEADNELRGSVYPRLWREEAARAGAIHCEVVLRSEAIAQALDADLATLPSSVEEGLRAYLIAKERPDLVDLALRTLEEVAA